MVLQGLGIGPGDDVVVSNHGYLTAGWSVEARGGDAAHRATSPSTRDPADVVAAFAAAVTDRTRLVVIDQITSPTALVLPVAEVAAAVAPVPVLVDAAHVPGALPGLDVEALGVAFWVGNLHKWAYTPRAAAVALGGARAPRRRCGRSSPRGATALPFPERFDLQGTVDHSAWLAVPDGLAAWHAPRRVGAGRAQRRPAPARGRARARRARHREPARRHTLRPCLRLVALPDGVADDDRGRRGAVAAAVRRRLRRPAGGLRGSRATCGSPRAPYNDEDDYARLAEPRCRAVLRGA